jgi:hypothetical protein
MQNVTLPHGGRPSRAATALAPQTGQNGAMFGGSARQPRQGSGMEAGMDDGDYARKLDELDHLLNDPEVPLQPDRVWSLLAEISHHDLSPG